MVGSNAVGHNRKDGTVGGATVVDTRADSVDDIVRGAKELSGTVSESAGTSAVTRSSDASTSAVTRSSDVVDVGGGPRLVGGFLGCACRVAGVPIVLYGVGIGFGLAAGARRRTDSPGLRVDIGVGFGFALLTGVRLGMCIIVGFGIGTHFGLGLGLIF